MITCDQLTRKFITLPTGAYVAGTIYNVAHGLGYPPAIIACSIRLLSITATGTDDSLNFSVVSSDATNVQLKAAKTINPATAILVIDLDRDLGGRPAFV